MSIQNKLEASIKNLQALYGKYDIKGHIACFSGGHDSLLSTYIASQVPGFLGCAWADTLTGTRETREYIREVTTLYGWELKIKKPAPVRRYEQYLITFGFPSPAVHNIMYNRLKDTPLNQLHGAYADRVGCKRSEILQVTGLRKSESQRRNAFVEFHNVKMTKAKTPKIEKIMCNPIFDWTKEERDQAINELGLLRNAYADHVGHSYECMCYANMVKGEREIRAAVSPEYEAIEQKREELVRNAYELQLMMLNAGMIDKDDITIDPSRLNQGWHLTKKIKAKDLDNQDPFNLCSSCMGDRAVDGTGGVDYDTLYKLKTLSVLSS